MTVAFGDSFGSPCVIRKLPCSEPSGEGRRGVVSPHGHEGCLLLPPDVHVSSS